MGVFRDLYSALYIKAHLCVHRALYLSRLSLVQTGGAGKPVKSDTKSICKMQIVHNCRHRITLTSDEVSQHRHWKEEDRGVYCHGHDQ